MMARTPLASMQFPGLPDTYTIPQKTSDLTNDSGFLTAPVAESDLSEELQEKVNASNEGVLAVYPHDTVTGSIASFPDGADGIPVKNLTVAIEPVQSGSGNPSPDNVRPISGWTGANVTRCGKNLFDPNVYTDYLQEDGSVKAPVYQLYNQQIPLPKSIDGVTCTFSAKIKIISGSTTAKNVRVSAINTQSGEAIGGLVNSTEYTESKVTFVATPNTALRIGYGDGSLGVVQIKDVQLEIGSGTGGFEPYNATTIPITFPSEAGTVYGGTLDVTTGKLTVDRAIITADEIGNFVFRNGSNVPTVRLATADILVPSVATNDSVVNSFICSMLTPTYVNNVYRGSSANASIAVSGGTFTRFWIRWDEYITDSATLKQALKDSGFEVVINLTTSTEYTLTPIEVKTLLAQNNIWADCGDTTVNYRADTTLFVNKKIAALAAAMN
jgi:hypothetical protein